MITRYPRVYPIVLLSSAALSACGGGGEATSLPPEIAEKVESLFTGGYVDSGGGGAGGGAGGGGGGAGAGGGLGQFRNALVEVHKLSTGSKVLLGSSTTNPTNGMVTVYPGAYAGPVLITVKGRAGATYFDEHTKSLLPFGPGEELNAVIAKLETTTNGGTVDRNYGMTPYTDAAYRFALANFTGGIAALADPTKVDEANEVVRQALNGQLPATLQIESITRLPFLVGPQTAAGSMSEQHVGNSTYGLVLSGLTIAAGKHNPSLSSPGLSIAKQLASDLNDGIIDFRSKDGAVVAPVGQESYTPQTLAPLLAQGALVISQTYGTPTLSTSKDGYVAYANGVPGGRPQGSATLLTASGTVVEIDNPRAQPAVASGLPKIDTLYGNVFTTAITADGQAFIRTTEDAARDPTIQGLFGPLAAGQFKQIQGFGPDSGGSVGARSVRAVRVSEQTYHALIVTKDGGLWSAGPNTAGQLGRPTTAPTDTTFARVAFDVPVVVEQAIAVSRASLARSGDGAVWSWGSNASLDSRSTPGLLGRGANAPATNRPTRVPNLPAIAHLAGDEHSIVAVSTDGRAFVWGSPNHFIECRGATSAEPRPVTFPAGTPKVLAAGPSGKAGQLFLDASGTLWYWGCTRGAAGSLQSNPGPVQVNGIGKVGGLLTSEYSTAARDRSGNLYTVADGVAIRVSPEPAAGQSASR